MVIGGLIAAGNRDRMMQLARDLDIEVPEDVIFLSEGKEPSRLRGFFFLAVGVIGRGKMLAGWKKREEKG